MAYTICTAEKKGFDKAIWQVQEDITKEGVGLILTHISPHLEEGYPGTLSDASYVIV